MKKFKKIIIKNIKVEAMIGADVYECIVECISLSATKGVPIDLEHNGINIRIDTKSYLEEKYNEWEKKLTEKIDK